MDSKTNQSGSFGKYKYIAPVLMPIQMYCWRVMELNSVQNRTSLCKIDWAINILGKIDGSISFYYFQWLHLPKAITSEHASWSGAWWETVLAREFHPHWDGVWDWARLLWLFDDDSTNMSWSIWSPISSFIFCSEHEYAHFSCHPPQNIKSTSKWRHF